jgi:hypothetical protein
MSSDSRTLSFEEFADFIREWASIPRRIAIRSETLFENDLGITGDDGCDLLKATEHHFGVLLASPEHGYRDTFGLASDEVLFHSEGLGWDWTDIVRLFRPTAMPSSVRDFKVGELFQAVRNAPARPAKRRSVLGLSD